MVVIDLIASIKDLTDKLTQFGKDFERRSLSMGLTFEQASQRLGKGFDQLHGDMSDRMAVGLESVRAGLQTTDGGLSQLINQQKLTGQQWQQTASIWGNVVAAGVASEEAMKVLAESTIELGDTYTIQTSLLTNVIKSLDRSLVDMGLADMGPNVIGAIAQLQATMGPLQKANFEKVTQMIFDTSVEGYQKLALLNIPNIREQLSASHTLDEAATLFMSAAITGGKTIDDFTSDADQVFFRLGQAGQIFGANAKLFSPVAQALAADTRRSTEERSKFFEQWDIMFKDVIAPLEEIFHLLVYPNLKNLAIAITSIGKVLVANFTSLVDSFGGTAGLIISVDAFKTIILDSAQKIVDAVEMIPPLFAYIFGSDGYLIQIFTTFGTRLSEKANEVWDGVKIDHLIPMWNDIRLEFLVVIQHIRNAWEMISNPRAALIDELKTELVSRLEVLALQGVNTTTLGQMVTGVPDVETAMQIAGRIAVAEVRAAEEARGADAMRAALTAQGLVGMRDHLRQMGLVPDPTKMPVWEFEHQNLQTEANIFLENLLESNRETAEQVAQINDKVPDPNDGGLLAESAFILGDAIERVLGFDRGPQGIDLWEEMVALQREIVEVGGNQVLSQRGTGIPGGGEG
jgi:hypothetical protein